MENKIKLIAEDVDMVERFRNYTHTDPATRLCEALTDGGYDLDDLTQAEFDEILDALIQ